MLQLESGARPCLEWCGEQKTPAWSTNRAWIFSWADTSTQQGHSLGHSIQMLEKTTCGLTILPHPHHPWDCHSLNYFITGNLVSLHRDHSPVWPCNGAKMVPTRLPASARWLSRDSALLGLFSYWQALTGRDAEIMGLWCFQLWCRHWAVLSQAGMSVCCDNKCTALTLNEK